MISSRVAELSFVRELFDAEETWLTVSWLIKRLAASVVVTRDGAHWTVRAELMDGDEQGVHKPE